MEKFFLAALQMVSGLGSANIKHLLDYFGSAENTWKASENEILESKCLSVNLCKNLLRHRKFFDLHKNIAEWDKKSIKLISIFEPLYPKLLKNIYNPPTVLFIRGNLCANKKYIAIVGARKFSVYGKSIAEKIAADLAERNFIIVSGAAHGIDTCAHRGALLKGMTVAVLGCGIDVAYPRENRKLLDEIAERGAVVSEYAPQTQPLAAFFPARNRIISGLALGTVVIEAAKRSGSLITAEMALSEGRDVFAVPGSIYSDQSVGCNHLIQQGAKLVTCAKDIYEEYEINFIEKSGCSNQKTTIKMSSEEKKIYDILSFDQPVGIDEMICRLRSDVSNISFLLLQMKLRGIIEETAVGTYVRSVKERI
ncbi:DNA-processing protein DprA [Pectinatus sottacetonis]|uniref:DNA-processing protein DprA n=1 Tax=Pectinatus sottacetonis TaxID=1002795 RepID=UPI0018C53703|nr:DNA-processing protein DprA [Pectinatus sottacetonis]